MTKPSSTTIIVRLMVGVVFLSEGIQKFMYPELRGAGRFAEIGFQQAEFWGTMTGFFEIFCGLMVLTGLLTRIAAVPLIIIMCVAIYTTKIPMIYDEGFWHMMHAVRTDYAMLLGSVFLLIRGGGRFSADRAVVSGKQEANPSA